MKEFALRLSRALARLAVLTAIALASYAATPQKPNIIFVLCDDLGYGDIGVLFQNVRATNNVRSEPAHFTPKIDKFADEGMQLRHQYCPASVCAPSRASLLLGVHQGHANVRDNQFDKALENNHTLGTVMKQAGYATAAIGKYGLQGSGTDPASWPAYPTKRGFDYYMGYVRHSDGHQHYPKEGIYTGAKEVWDMDTEISSTLDKCYTADLFTARAKKWIVDHQNTNAAQPFFLYLAYDTPHAVDELPTQAYPAGGGTNGGLQWLGTPGQMINTTSGTVDSYYYPDYATATWDDDNNPSTPEVAWPGVYKRYASAVRRLDDCVGDLVQLLKDLAIDTNTLVVFSSDNGPSIESYLPENLAANFFNSFGPFDGIKRDLWEGGIRMPTLVRWPGHVPAGVVSAHPSQFHDWMATFCEVGGLTAPARSDGVSLVPTLLGVGSQRDSTIYVEYYHNGTTPGYSEFVPAHRNRARKQMQAVRLGDYLGVRYNIASHADNFEIYNVVTDPQEAVNLATNAGYTSLQQQMKNTVLWCRRPDSSAPRPYDAELLPAVTAAPVTSGVVWRAYTNSFPWVPELTVLTNSSGGETNLPTVAVRPADTNLALLFTGFIRVPADGDYTFYLTADKGALLRIHEATVLDADFGYAGGTEISGTMKLKTGLHPFRLYYVHGTNGAPSLDFQWSGPTFLKQPVPASAFFREGTGPATPPAPADDSGSTIQGTPLLLDVLANDIDDGLPQPLTIAGVDSPAGGSATVLSNQVLYTPRTGFLGTDKFSYTVTDGSNSATANVTVKVCFFDTNSIWLPFNQTSGLTAEESGGRTLGALGGFADETSCWVTGRFGRGLDFNGSTTLVTLDPSLYLPPFGASPRTVCAWIKCNGTNVGAIVAWGPNADNRKWMMRLDSATATQGHLRVEIGGGYVISSQDLRDGNWHHVGAVLPALANPNATNIVLYVDGVRQVSVLTVSAAAINTDAAAATVGVDAQGRHFDGTIDEVRIYRRALSDSEMIGLATSTNQAAAAWYRRHFGDAQMDWNPDDDGDGGGRLLEYALGGEPQVPDASMMALRPRITADHLQLRFNRRVSGTSELVYLVQLSGNLQSWSAEGVTELGTAALLLPGLEEAIYQVAAAVPETAPLYARLKVTLP